MKLPKLKPGECRAVSLVALQCRCARCGHEWTTAAQPKAAKLPEPPLCCGRCKSPYWRTVAKEKK